MFRKVKSMPSGKNAAWKRRWKLAKRDGLDCKGGCGFVAKSRNHAADVLTIDHILPKSKGGPNTLKNSQLMCQPCNQHKSDTLVYHPRIHKLLRFERHEAEAVGAGFTRPCNACQ